MAVRRIVRSYSIHRANADYLIDSLGRVGDPSGTLGLRVYAYKDLRRSKGDQEYFEFWFQPSYEVKKIINRHGVTDLYHRVTRGTNPDGTAKSDIEDFDILSARYVGKDKLELKLKGGQTATIDVYDTLEGRDRGHHWPYGPQGYYVGDLEFYKGESLVDGGFENGKKYADRIGGWSVIDEQGRSGYSSSSSKYIPYERKNSVRNVNRTRLDDVFDAASKAYARHGVIFPSIGHYSDTRGGGSVYSKLGDTHEFQGHFHAEYLNDTGQWKLGLSKKVEGYTNEFRKDYYCSSIPEVGDAVEDFLTIRIAKRKGKGITTDDPVEEGTQAPRKETPKKPVAKPEPPKKEAPKAPAPKKPVAKVDPPKKEAPKKEVKPKAEKPKEAKPKATAPKAPVSAKKMCYEVRLNGKMKAQFESLPKATKYIKELKAQGLKPGLVKLEA